MATKYAVKFNPTVPIESVDGLMNYLRQEQIEAQLTNSTGRRDWTLTTEADLNPVVYRTIKSHHFIEHFRKLPVRD